MANEALVFSTCLAPHSCNGGFYCLYYYPMPLPNEPTLSDEQEVDAFWEFLISKGKARRENWKIIYNFLSKYELQSLQAEWARMKKKGSV